MPAVAFAQEGEDDEFYQDPDTAYSDDESEGADVELEVDVGEDDPLPFRNTTVIYENIFSAASPAVDLSPAASFYYAMSYSFRPRYYVRDWFSLRLRLDVEHELTDSSTTTQRREPLVSDLWLDFYFQDLLAGVSETWQLEGYFRLAFPASKVSQARTMIMGGTLGVSAHYTADVLEGLRLGYGINITKYFNQYSTATQEAPSTTCTPGSAINCDSQLNLGTRNPSALMRNVLSLEFSPIEDLTFAISVIFYDYFLYQGADVNTDDLPVDVVCSDPNGCPVEEDPFNTNRRSSIWYLVELSYSPLPWLGLSLGTSTFNPQLTPESDYRSPFFNRFTQVYFDVSLTIDQLVQSIRDRRRNRGSASSQSADEV